MKKRYILIAMGLILFILLAILGEKDTPREMPEIIDEITTEFSNEQIVEIIGYDGDAMEPYISRDEKYLFFNNDGENKDLFYAEKIDDITFEFKGEVLNANTQVVDANPTMDSQNNFYFITTRDIESGDLSTLYTGVFEDGSLKNLKKVKGTINVDEGAWVNMGVEITKDGNTMYTSNANFESRKSFPSEGNIRFAIKEGEEFNIPNNEKEILKNINTNYAIEYAGEISDNELELFYSQVTLSSPPQFKLYHAKRNSSNEPFEIPKLIAEPFSENTLSLVEGPTLSIDEKRLYYHKHKDGKASIFMLSRT